MPFQKLYGTVKMLDKVSLNQKIQNFIAANPSVQGMNQTQLISCLIENGIVTLTELQEIARASCRERV